MIVSFESVESRQLMSGSSLADKAHDAIESLVPEIELPGKQKGKTVVTDAAAALKDAAKPSATALKKLKTDAAAAFADKKLSADEKALLVADVTAVLTSGKVSGKLAKLTGTDLGKMFADKTVSTSDDKDVVSQLVTQLSGLKK